MTEPTITPERLAYYRRAAQDMIDWYKRGDCSVTVRADDLRALCDLAARGLAMITGDEILAQLGLNEDEVEQAELDELE